MFALDLICRQPLVQTYTDGCQHTHNDDCCGAPRINGKLPEGHQHGRDCCEHECGFDAADCGSGIDYIPARHGAHKQCGRATRFTAWTPTAATDEAVAAGWRVDISWRGVHTRSDVCPGHNEGRGTRPNLPFVAGTLAADAYAA